ncbi:hypothetical protein [Erwinia sp. S38]|uniref:hypothetical protein n=1 Tax=Erwinia sp. S38 TaxID=2769338 RepID=UPI00190DD7A2|nr:hypothetical protein [Erwinia sp. S38]MBK0003175.1 hypothetical protein [Erwinia sp. S38]
MKKLLVLIFSLLLYACAATPPSQMQLHSADYGELPENYQQQVKNWWGTMLKDPYSAQYTFGKPSKAWFKDGILAESGGAMRFGWLIPITVNAKNSYGAYTGLEAHTVFYSHGKIESADAQVGVGYTGKAPD